MAGLNTYDFVDNTPCKTFLEETRQWRKHEHEHIQESTEQIMENIDNSREEIIEQVQTTEENITKSIEIAEKSLENQIKESETSIKSELNRVIESHIIPMEEDVKDVIKTQTEHTNWLKQIWNKVSIFNH